MVKTKYIDDELDKNIILRFIQSLQNYLKLSIGNDTNKLTKQNKINITVLTEMRNPNTGQSLSQKWTLNCLNKYYNAKLNTFLKSTTSTSPTAESGASSVLQSDGHSCLLRHRLTTTELIM